MVIDAFGKCRSHISCTLACPSLVDVCDEVSEVGQVRKDVKMALILLDVVDQALKDVTMAFIIVEAEGKSARPGRT